MLSGESVGDIGAIAVSTVIAVDIWRTFCCTSSRIMLRLVLRRSYDGVIFEKSTPLCV